MDERTYLWWASLQIATWRWVWAWLQQPFQVENWHVCAFALLLLLRRRGR